MGGALGWRQLRVSHQPFPNFRFRSVPLGGGSAGSRLGPLLGPGSALCSGAPRLPSGTVQRFLVFFFLFFSGFLLKPVLVRLPLIARFDESSRFLGGQAVLRRARRWPSLSGRGGVWTETRQPWFRPRTGLSC